METRTPTWQLVRLPALFALATGILLILAWISFGGSNPLAPQGYRVDIPVGDASNLVPGSDVQTSGVDVGRIVEIKRDGGRALALVELDSDRAPLARDAVATVRTKTLLGEGYIEIGPGTEGSGAVPDGGALAARQVEPRVQLDEFLETLNPRTRAGIRRLVAGVSSAYDDRGQELNAAIGRLEPASAGMADLLGVLDAHRGDLSRAIAGSAEIFAALGERRGALRSAITSGNRMFDATAARSRELTATIQALPPFLSQLEQTSGRIEATSGDLNRAAIALRSATPHLAPALRAIDTGAPEFTRLFRELPATAAAARGGLPALDRTAKASVPALKTLYPALRELNPFLALLSANSQELVGVMGNLGNALNGRLLGPGNLELPNASANLFLSNETLLGYRHRLPTNRLNPYIRPGGLREIGKRGHLLSYDCRNIKNPLLVPVVGLGAPPCEEQGAWDFLGKKQYFPKLERAAP